MKGIETVWTRRIQPEVLLLLVEMVTRAGLVRETMTVRAPFTGEEIGTVPACTGEDVNEALKRARRAQKEWSRLSFRERRAIFLRYHDMVLARQDELLDMVQIENGKTRGNALEEVLDIAINCRYYAFHGERLLEPVRRRGALPLLTTAWEYHHPVGVVGIIAPWNYPLTLAVSDAVPALLAGNSVILKPASNTPFTALLAVRTLHEAGLPKDLFQVLTGSGNRIGLPLIAGADFVCFTGSTATGRSVARQAGEQLIGCSMELGGKNPMLVLDDADLNQAVEGAVRGCFTNAGQLCISFERIYVQSGIYDAFVNAFLERTRSLRLGASFDYDMEVGSLASKEQLSKVVEHVRDAVEKGAKVLAGGLSRPDLGPWFHEPTILSGVTPDMLLAREETFGPVVAVYRFDDVQEAVDAANDSMYGLNASIWTRSHLLGQELATRIRCGTVNVNEAYAAAWGSVDAPMGGMKLSGLHRRHGREGILKYTEPQTVAVQRLVPVAPPPGMDVSLYARIMTALLRILRFIPGLR